MDRLGHAEARSTVPHVTVLRAARSRETNGKLIFFGYRLKSSVYCATDFEFAVQF